jgi:hypothetical protein
VNATQTLPSLRIRVKPSLPHIPGLFSVFTAEVDDICNSNATVLAAPAGSDAGYYCPSAGLYNFNTQFTLWGDPEAWYGSTYGYNMGVNVQFYDLEKEEEFAFCYVEVKIKQGPVNSYSTSMGFLGGALAGLGLTAGYMYRKRRVGTIELDPVEEGTTTHFELISDPGARV